MCTRVERRFGDCVDPADKPEAEAASAVNQEDLLTITTADGREIHIDTSLAASTDGAKSDGTFLDGRCRRGIFAGLE